jgi:hypothetical protein
MMGLGQILNLSIILQGLIIIYLNYFTLLFEVHLTKREWLLATNMNEDISVYRHDDEKEDYRKKTEETFTETVFKRYSGNGNKGGEIGEKVGNILQEKAERNWS